MIKHYSCDLPGILNMKLIIRNMSATSMTDLQYPQFMNTRLKQSRYLMFTKVFSFTAPILMNEHHNLWLEIISEWSTISLSKFPAFFDKLHCKTETSHLEGEEKNKHQAYRLRYYPICSFWWACYWLQISPDAKTFTRANESKYSVKLHTITHKDSNSSYADLRALRVVSPLIVKFGYPHFDKSSSRYTVNNSEYLFSTTELADVLINLGQAPASSLYSALRQAYPM